MEIFLIIILGWPSVIVGYILLAGSIVFEKKKVGIIGALLSMGFCLIACLYPPPTRWMALAALICNWLSVYWKGNHTRYWRFLFLIPISVLIIWMAYAVLSQ